MNHELTRLIKSELLALGVDLVAFGGLAELPPDEREGLPVGIGFGIRIPKRILRDIEEAPTPEYYAYYQAANAKLWDIAGRGEDFIRGMGYNAVGLTRERVARTSGENSSRLPLKTIATRAGLGWIGKCALLVTPEFGSAIRLGGILTDAPLETSAPVNESRCGDCDVCVKSCPGRAPGGGLWSRGRRRDEFFNAAACRETAYARGLKYAGVTDANNSICGKCIAVCPWTKRHIAARD